MAELFTYASDVTGGWLGIVVLLCLWVIMTVSLISTGAQPRKVFASSGVVTAVFAILFKFIEFVPDIAVVFAVIIAVVSTLALWLGDE